jgi:hypothetical protein
MKASVIAMKIYIDIKISRIFDKTKCFYVINVII